MNHDNILAYLKVGFDCLAPKFFIENQKLQLLTML